MFPALGYAEDRASRSRSGLVRNHYVGRTFIEPKQSIRHFGVKVKLNPVREVVDGQADRARRRLDRPRHDVPQDRADAARRPGRRKSTSASPRRRRSDRCHYGIDTPTRSELIAANQSVDEIRQFIEADSLGYLSVEGMLEAFGRPQQATCTACFTGIYPVEIEEEEREKEHALDAK